MACTNGCCFQQPSRRAVQTAVKKTPVSTGHLDGPFKQLVYTVLKVVWKLAIVKTDDDWVKACVMMGVIGLRQRVCLCV